MGRILELDVIRAIAIILIVFSHFPPLSIVYIDPAIKYWCAIIGVSLFIFISGLVLNPFKARDIKGFYKRRALRVYPPYLVIMGVYILIQYGLPNIANTLAIYLSPPEIIINILGLQALLNVPSYGVLWFVGLILVYYAVYPLLRGTAITLAVALGTFAAFVILHQYGLIIPQLVYYWPVFIAGVLINNLVKKSERNHPFLGGLRSKKLTKKIYAPFLLISRFSYQIYLTHYLIIGIAVLLFSSAAVAPMVVNDTNQTIWSKNVTANVTAIATATPKPPHYVLYFFTMAAPCPAGIQMQKDVTAWAATHPTVEFHILSTESELGIKYNSVLSPTTVMLKDGKVVGRFVGIFNVNELTAAYNK